MNKQPNERLDTDAAARYLGLAPATLACKRNRGGGPRYIKRGNRVSYEIKDLDEWDAFACKHRTSTAEG